MRKFYWMAAFAGALSFMASCGHNHSEEGHNHEQELTESHDHSGEEHNHSAEGHDHAAEGHDHSAESHDHSAESHDHSAEGHDHSAEEHDHASGSHDHSEGEAGAHSDEIILPVEKAKAAGVVVTEVAPVAFHQVIRTGGEIISAQNDETTVVATTSGIVSFPVATVEGRAVSRGERLLNISAKQLAEGDPAERARIAYETAKSEYDRAAKLVEPGIVSRQEFATIKEKYENARLSYEALSAQSGKGGQFVASPMAGYIKTCLVKSGDFVTVGQPLMTLTRNQRLFLRADVSERYYKDLRRIVSANFRTPYDDRVYELSELHGRVLSYGKAANADSRYLPVTFEFDNRGDIVPGSYVEVFLITNEVPQAMVLPKTAITEEQGLYFIYCQIDAEGYRKQEVKLGGDDGRNVQILSGVKPGDRVVTEGAYHVKLASATNAIPAHSHEH